MSTATWVAIFVIVVVAAAALGPVTLVAGMMGYSVYSPGAYAGALALAASFFKPDWGYLVFLLALPIRSEDYALAEVGTATIRVADIIALAVFIGWLLYGMAAERRLPFRKTPLDVPLIFWASFTILTGVWATSKASALSKALQLIYALILYYMFYDLTRRRGQLVPIFWAWMIGGEIIAVTTITDYLSGSARAESALDVNQLTNAEYLDYMTFLGLGLLLAIKNLWARLLLLGFVATSVVALLVNESRGAQVAFIVCTGFFILAWPPSRNFLKWIPTAIALSIVPAVILMAALDFNPVTETQDAFDRWYRLYLHPSTDFGVKFRFDLWYGAWRAFKRIPLTGFGIGSLGDKIEPYIPAVYPDTQILHNLYLEMLVTLGVFGFILFCWFFVKTVWQVWKAWWECPRDDFYFPLMTGAFAALLSQWVGWLAFGQIIENRVMWTALSLPFAIARIAREEAQPPPREPSESVTTVAST